MNIGRLGSRRMLVLASALAAGFTLLVGAGSALAGSPVTLTISTQTSFVDGVGVGAKSRFFDTATLSGLPQGSPAPTGTVTFNVYGPITYPYVYGPGSCVGAPEYTSTNPVDAAGTSATSNAFFPPEGEEEIYMFTASYSGDAVYAPVASECNAPGESVTVPPVAFADYKITTSPGSPSPPHGSASPPVSLSAFSFSPAVFAVGGGTRIRDTAESTRPGRGVAWNSTISYTLSGPDAVTITIGEVVPGLHDARGVCLPATAATRKALLVGRLRRKSKASPSSLLLHVRCNALRKVGALVRAGMPGSNSFTFAGRVGSRVLAAGSYRAEASVSSASTSPSIAIAAFQIVSPRSVNSRH